MAELEDKTTPDEFILSRYDEVIARAPNDACFQASLQSYYAGLKIQRFWLYGREEDLVEAVEKGSQAVTNTTCDYVEYAGRLNLLGVILISRYKRVGNMNDLHTAIQLSLWAVKFTPSDHPDLAVYLNNLGNQLESRFERAGMMEDLEEAIQTARQAIELTPPNHPNIAACLHSLGNKLKGRFERTGRMEDHEEAIQTARQAVEVTPPNHPELAARLNSLGNNLQEQFKWTGRMEDFKEAIRTVRRAVKLTSPNHPDLVACLINLGNMLLLSHPSENEEPLQRFLQAWNCANGIPFLRLTAAVKAIDLLKQRARWSLATQVVIDIAHLLPLLNNRSLGPDDQRHVVSQFFGVASDGCALILQNGETPSMLSSC